MEKRILRLGMSFLAFGFWACNKPCGNPFDAERGSNALEAAEKMKPSLKQLIDSQNYKAMGFQSVEEVKRVAIGKPVNLIRLRCDSLKAYKDTKGENLAPLAMSEEVIFPILVGKQTRAVLVVDSIPDPDGRSQLDWITVSFGNTPLAALIDTTIGENSTQDESARAGYSLVEIPALNLTFFRHTRDNQAVLSLAQNMGTLCWTDSVPGTRSLTAVLSTLAACVEAQNLCDDVPRIAMSEAPPAAKQDSLAAARKQEKRSAK
jgi:hypothetical protein